MGRGTLGAGALIFAGALLLGPAASGASTDKASAPKSHVTITIKNFMFSPMSVTVKPGAKITVTNKDSVTHTLSGQGKGHFNTGDLGHDKTKTFDAPKKAGTYHYICNIHQYMKGTIKVS
jgi:plastocyanin